MKLFILYGGWYYEGNDDPVGVYSTKEKAQAKLDSLDKESCNFWHIKEYELDKDEAINREGLT